MSKEFLEFLQQLINGLAQGSIYALIALGYTMVFGVLRFINFAHGDIYMLGAFGGLYALQISANVSAGEPIEAGYGSLVIIWVASSLAAYLVARRFWSRRIVAMIVFLAVLCLSRLAMPFLYHWLLVAVGKFVAGEAGLFKTFRVLLVAMGYCAIVGIVIEWLCYKPLRDRPKLTVLITAIGVSLLLENGGQFVFGARPQYFPGVINDVRVMIPESLGSLSKLFINVSQVLVFGVTFFLLIALTYIVRRTKMGMAMRALSFNPVAAQLMGININVIISFTFGLGSALAGAAGILTSIQQPSIDPLMGVNAGLKAFVAAVLGGIGNLPGAALGGILIGVTEVLVVGYVNPTYRDPIVFGVLILVLLVKPTGLLGASEREKV